MGDSIRSFEDLQVWQNAINLSSDIYKLTAKFPKSEQFGITNQIRRSSSSISANIAEGFGRSTAKDKLQFYHIAYGSLLETKNFAILSCKIGFITDSQLDKLTTDITDLQKLLNGFIRSTKKRLG